MVFGCKPNISSGRGRPTKMHLNVLKSNKTYVSQRNIMWSGLEYVKVRYNYILNFSLIIALYFYCVYAVSSLLPVKNVE